MTIRDMFLNKNKRTYFVPVEPYAFKIQLLEMMVSDLETKILNTKKENLELELCIRDEKKKVKLLMEALKESDNPVNNRDNFNNACHE